MSKNYEETDSRLDAERTHYETEKPTDLDEIKAQRNYILTGLQSTSDACEEGHHGECHHLLHDICKCECHKAPAAEEPKQDDFDNGYDFERDEELQAEIDADAALNDDEAEIAEEAAIAASPRTWGGHRDNAGRPKSERSEPLYQAGYQAGYKAGYRSYEERLGMSYRAIMHIVMNADISEEQRAQILENIKKDKELKSNG